MRRPFRSRCFGTCHFCIKTSPHGYKLHAIVRKLQELRYSVICYLSYLSSHSFNILDDLAKSDISYFLLITVPSAVRRPPSAVRIRRPHLLFTESHLSPRLELRVIDLESVSNKNRTRISRRRFLYRDLISQRKYHAIPQQWFERPKTSKSTSFA